MSVFTCEIKDDVLNDLLHDLKWCNENNEKIILGSGRIEILLGYIDYLCKWIKYENSKNVKEIERLNNIINEIIECIDSLYVPYEMEENWVFYGKEYDDREKVIEKIKELKGVDKE